MLSVMRAHENGVVFSDNVVRKMVTGYVNGCFDVDIQNITEIYFQEAAANHFHKLSDKGIEAHTDFQESGHICHGLLQHIFGDYHAAFVHGPWNGFEAFRFIVNKHNGRISHGLEHAVKYEDVLKEPIGIEIFIRNRRCAEQDNLAVSYTL